MKSIMAFLISVLFVWGCNNASDKSTNHHADDSHTEHQHNHDVQAIELDHGNKWVVNDEMKPFVLKGEELVNMYIQEGGSDYMALAQQLKDQNKQLIESCTMQGKGHDELHKWLHPHLEMVSALENEPDATKSNELVLKLQHSYQQYHRYFN
jgi:hypothetical protein